MIARSPLPNLIAPEGIGNDLLERVLLWAEFAAGTSTSFSFAVLDELVGVYGDAGLTLLGSALYRSRVENIAPDFEPDADAARSHAAELVAAGDYDGAVEVMREHRSKLARYHGRIVLRCQWCGRYRHGAEWNRQKSPTGWLVIDGATCPDCGQADERDEQDEAADLERLYTWMAEGAEPAAWSSEADAPADPLADQPIGKNGGAA